MLLEVHIFTEKVTATMANGTTATTIMNTYGNVTESTCGDHTVINTYDDDQQLLGLMADS